MEIMVFNSDNRLREFITMQGEYNFKVGDKLMIGGDYLECTGRSIFDGAYCFKEYTPEKSIYTGKEILDLILEKKFKQGDKIIATQKDNLGEKYTSTFTYKHIVNNDYEFVDDEFENCVLEVFDLVNYTFEIVDMRKYNTDKIKGLESCIEAMKNYKTRLSEYSKILSEEIVFRHDAYKSLVRGYSNNV